MQEWAIELEAQQIIALGGGGTKSLGAKCPGGERSPRGDGRAGNLKPKLAKGRKDTPYGDEHAASAYVDRGGKLHKFFCTLVASADKYGDRQRQPGPLAPFSPVSCVIHPGVSVGPFDPIEST